MKIVVVGSSKWKVYAPAFVSGFRSLGNKVIFIDIENYQYKLPIISGLLNKIQAKYCIGLPLISYNEAIVDTVLKEKPDFCFFYSCNHVFPSTYYQIKQCGVKIFTYNNDDPFSPLLIKQFRQYFLKSIKIADHNFVYRKKNLDDYRAFGVNNVSVLLPYYLTNSNYNTNCVKDLSVVYIGHFENDGRDNYLKALLEAGIDLHIYSGKNWVDYDIDPIVRPHILPAVYGTDYNYTLNRAKIALVFFSKLNSDTYTRRCFEIPPTMAVMLSEYTDDMNNLYPENECALYFRSPEELVKKCKTLLSNTQEMNRISNNCRKRIEELGGSEIDRCKEIISVFNNLK